MNNRFKKKLTHEVILKEFSDILDSKRRRDFFALLVHLLILPAFPFFLIHLFLKLKSRNKIPEEDDVKIWEDSCIREKYVHSERNPSLYLEFEAAGTLDVRKWYLTKVHIRSDQDTFTGQKFYLAYVQHRRHRAILIYPQADWRTLDLSPEEIEEEIQQEMGLISRIMDSGNHAFITKAVQERISDPRAWTVSLTKPSEQLTLMERLARNHFRGFMAPALEYICRYCAPSLKESIIPHFTEREKNLYDHFLK